VHLVTGGTAGLGDDLLHVLNLSLAADEGTELERKMLAFGSGKIDVLYARRLDQRWCLGHRPWSLEVEG
jgi:hypothetical protein